MKSKERMLRQSQAALNAAQGIAKLGNWERNLFTGKIYWSDEQYRLHGYEPEEVEPTFELVRRHIHPDDLDNFLKKREADFYGHNKFHEEYRIIRKDRVARTVHVITTIRRNQEGAPLQYFGTTQDITSEKQIEEELRKSERDLERRVLERTEELRIESKNLEEVNTSLRIVLDRRERDKKDLEEKILLNVRQLISPYCEKLDQTGLSPAQRSFLDMIKSNLAEIVAPFTRTLSAKYQNLTPTEIQIADLLRQGKNSKEIGKLLNLSSRTIDTHRKNIRKKLGINKKNVNLKSYLMSLD